MSNHTCISLNIEYCWYCEYSKYTYSLDCDIAWWKNYFNKEFSLYSTIELIKQRAGMKNLYLLKAIELYHPDQYKELQKLLILL
jgi:hypothetical protein